MNLSDTKTKTCQGALALVLITSSFAPKWPLESAGFLVVVVVYLALEDLPKQPCYSDTCCVGQHGELVHLRQISWVLVLPRWGWANLTNDKNSWNTLFRTKVWTHVMCVLFFFVYLFLLNVKGEDLIAGKWCFSLELRSVCREFALLSSPQQSAWVKILKDLVQVW